MSARMKVFGVVAAGLAMAGCKPPPLDNTPRGENLRIERAAADMRDFCIPRAPDFADFLQGMGAYAEKMGADSRYQVEDYVMVVNNQSGRMLALDRASKSADAYSCGVLAQTVDSAAFRAVILETVRASGYEASAGRNDTMAVHQKSRAVVRHDISNGEASLALVFFDRTTGRGNTPAAFLVRTPAPGQS